MPLAVSGESNMTLFSFIQSYRGWCHWFPNRKPCYNHKWNYPEPLSRV